MIEPKREKYYWTGMHEPHVQRAIVESLAPGDTFWDVGAHVGFLSLLAARTVGESGSVVAFEPMPANRARLQASIAAMNVENVAVASVALSRQAGTQTLHAAEASTMWTLDAEQGDPDGISVICSTLDLTLEERPAPQMVKVDAEGVEVDVLRGGLRLIELYRPILLIEFSTPELLAEAQCILPDQYDWSHIGANHWLLSWKAHQATDATLPVAGVPTAR